MANRKTDTPTTMTQSQVWLVNSRQPGDEVADEAGARAGARLLSSPAAASSPASARPGLAGAGRRVRRPRNAAGRSRSRNQALTRYVRPSMPMPHPGPTAATRTPARNAPRVIEPLITRLLRPLACCSRDWAHHLRRQPHGRRPEERLAHAHGDLDQGEVPHLRHAGDEQRGRECLQDEAQDVGGQHDALPLQPVRPHAADQHEHGERDEVGGLTMPMSVAVPPISSTANGKATTVNMHADHGGGLAEEELAVLGLAEDGEAVGELAHRCILLGRRLDARRTTPPRRTGRRAILPAACGPSRRVR